MNKKKYNVYITPLYFLLIGIGIAIFSLLTKGTFEPFNLLAFIFMAIFEVFFRKQKRISSNLLSFACGLILILSIKLYVIDFVAIKSDIPELNLKKGDKIFYQPSLYKLRTGDIVLYKSEGKESKQYLAVMEEIKNNSYTILILSQKEYKEIGRKEIKGKVIFPISNIKGMT